MIKCLEAAIERRTTEVSITRSQPLRTAHDLCLAVSSTIVRSNPGVGAGAEDRRQTWSAFRRDEGFPREWLDDQKSRDFDTGRESIRYVLPLGDVGQTGGSQDDRFDMSAARGDGGEGEADSSSRSEAS